jgi:hypothetical protein
MSKHNQIKSELTPHWIIVGVLLTLLLTLNLFCHTLWSDVPIHMDNEQRVFIRTIFYVIAIILFPLVNLLRHILLRLNQTMPGENPAKKRYLLTTTVTLLIIESVGLFGIIMFILGDGFNTLYIFSILAALGLFLHRPKQEEYRQIIEALATISLTENPD